VARSSTSLVRVYPGRPAWVGDECVSVHDGFYLARRAVLLVRVIAAPVGSKRRLFRTVARLTKFDREQVAWYAALVPPLKPPIAGQADSSKFCKNDHLLERGTRGWQCKRCKAAYDLVRAPERKARRVK